MGKNLGLHFVQAWFWWQCMNCIQAGFHVCATVRLAGHSGSRGGTTADKISGNTGAGRSFSRLLTRPYPMTAVASWGRHGPSFPLWWEREHERETPMGVTGAHESLYHCLRNAPSHAHRMTSSEVCNRTACHRNQISAAPQSLNETLPQCGRTQALNLTDLTAGLRPRARQQDRCVWNKLFIHSQSPLTAAHWGLHLHNLQNKRLVQESSR